MQRRLVLIFGAAVIGLTGVSSGARADVRRERTERRPYVVEIGDPYAISRPTLELQARYMSAMHAYLNEYGYPDYAEVQEIAPEWPWDSYEVRLYYLRRNLELDFGHVFVSGALLNLGAEKFRGDIEEEKRQQVEVALAARLTAPVVAPPPAPMVSEAPAEPPAAEAASVAAEEPPAGSLESYVERIEAAADRAAQAADRAVASSEAAVQAADRSVAMLEQLEAPARSRTSHR